MKLKAVVYKNGYTKDGTLKSHQGRIVIYENFILISRGNSPDHMALLYGLASKNRLNRDEVVSNAIRLYYTIEDNMMIVSQNRKIDEDILLKNLQHYGRLILNAW
ncbi:MAG: hypothetical protein AB1404_02135 [Spirochaetota bacterium]|mgnify:CR=1 FL=1|jgi:hypothetical protein